MERVLVLMSTYNGSEYIREQYESLKRQENIDVDVIVRDDGSDDNTIQKLHEMGIEKIITGENIGPFDSFYELLMIAPEEYNYYAFCDQDDIWTEDKLLVAISYLECSDKQKPALYYCGQTIVDSRLNTIYIHRMDVYRSRYANCIFNQMAGCTAVFNKSLLKKLKKEKPQLKSGHDAWTYRLCAMVNGDIYVDENSHIFYRQHGNNAVGLMDNYKSRVKRSLDYVFNYIPSESAFELLRIHSYNINERERAFLNDIIQCNTVRESRNRLLHNYNIDFNNSVLRFLFRLKLFLRKM